MIRSAGDHPDPRRFIELAGWLATLEGNYWRRSVAVAPVLRSNEPEVLIQAALAGVGIAVVSQTMAAEYLARGLLVPVLPAWQPPPRDVNALYAPGRAQMPQSGRSLIFCWQRSGRIRPRSPYRVPTLQVGCATTGARSTITPKAPPPWPTPSRGDLPRNGASADHFGRHDAAADENRAGSQMPPARGSDTGEPLGTPAAALARSSASSTPCGSFAGLSAAAVSRFREPISVARAAICPVAFH